jgi:formylglycine-generating enzyme required for sulfatase activity
MCVLRAAVIVLLIALLPLHARAEDKARLALLIGNQGYAAKVGPLKNPHHDIAIVGNALEADGFKVTALRDAGRRQVLSAVQAFGAELAKGGANGVGFLYYSGHGVSRPDDRANYLIPVDLKDTDSSNFWFDAVKLDDLLGELERAAPFAAHFVVFDACRNELKLPGRTIAKGLEPVAQRNGMFIAFATAVGTTASDGGEYAAAMARELVKPGQDHLQFFQNVREDVYSATGRQVPWDSNGLLRRVYFGGEAPQGGNTSSLPTTTTPEREWQQYGKDTKDLRLLEAFKEKHKADPVYARLAEARIDDLKKEEDKKAEAERLAAVQRQQEEEKRKRAEAEARAKAEAVRLALLQKEVEERKRAEGMKKQQMATLASHCIGVTVGQNERRCFKPGAGKAEHFKDCVTCPEMVVVPAGSFTMGSPGNEQGRTDDEVQVQVSIAAPFAVGRFAVTFDEWDACVADDACNGFNYDEGWGRGKHPVINVNWDDAKAYATWLSRKTGKSYRLLSEAEREYVTRAGTTTPFWWGSSVTPMQANYDGSADPYKGGGTKGEDRKRTVPVDTFEPNPWGLYNVHGNVWDWTADCWNDSNAGNPGDGSARTTGDCSIRVVRGGSWFFDPQFLRSAYRDRRKADSRYIDNLGFRLARTLNP